MTISTLSIEEAASMFGGMSKLSSILGVTRATLYNWLNDGSYYINWCKSDFETGSFINHLIVEKEVLYAGVPDPRECRSGYVYCVCNGNEMKIGKTRTPKQRIKTIKSEMIRGDSRVFVSKFVSDCATLENKTLQYFSESRISGEIFKSDFDRAVQFIKDNAGPINCGVRKKKPEPGHVMEGIDKAFSQPIE